MNTQYVTWGAGFMDYDNDGWPDILYVTGHVYPEIEHNLGRTFKTPRIVYRNLGNGKFKDVSAQMGPESPSASPAAAAPLAIMTTMAIWTCSS